MGTEGKVVSSAVNEIHQFVTAYRASETLIREYPANYVDLWNHH